TNGEASFVFDKNTCSAQIYKGGLVDSEAVISSDSYVPKFSTNGSGIWNVVNSVNNASCITEIIEGEGSVEVSGTKTSADGIFKIRYLKEEGKPLKTILEATNLTALTDKKFGGNPAGVIFLDEWIADALMQQIAAENNQAETAFCVKQDDVYHIRWFTPAVEVDLCGHATLATAHILFHHLSYKSDRINFTSKSGDLFVTGNGKVITLDFPVDYFLETELPDKLSTAMRHAPKETYIGKTDYLLVYDYEEIIKRLDPEYSILKEVRARGVIATAKGNDVDFVYRFFAPQSGINEDPATGSAQTTLMNYWSKKLNKKELRSLQLSPRLGSFSSKISGDRVQISGEAITYLEGEIEI
ncbi:MAG: PhzF family phenazine biosynthesis protein, partial [Chitinophagales bacterium]